MRSFITILTALASFAAAQQTNFEPGTGVRSLWIPFQTVAGTPVASIAGVDSTANVTYYVLSCPTASPACALAPNLTLTEGVSTARYETSNSAGEATIACKMSGYSTADCSQGQAGDGNIHRTSTTLGASQIVYQAVTVTQTMNNTSTQPVTVTVAPSSSTTSSTSTSLAGAETASGPWAMGGAVGAGLVALAAL